MELCHGLIKIIPVPPTLGDSNSNLVESDLTQILPFSNLINLIKFIFHWESGIISGVITPDNMSELRSQC